MTKPLDTHDVRQSAYRGQGPQSDATGIPDGKDRHDPSAGDVASPDDPSSTGRQQEEGDDRSGRTQPNLGQAGTYGASNEETEVTARNRTDDAPSKQP